MPHSVAGAARRRAAALTAVVACGAASASERLRIDVAYAGEVVAAAAGGLRSGARYLDNLDVTLELETGSLVGGAPGTLFLYGLYNNGSTFADERVGDLQVTSNIDAPEALRVYEAWYEFGQPAWTVRTGLYDLNSEFDVNETGSLFLNSSHGIGADFSQTGLNGPSIFPVTSLAVRAAWQGGRWAARLAVLDAVPGQPGDPSSTAVELDSDDGALLVGELDWTFANALRVWGGLWRYTAEFARPFSSGRQRGNEGAYLGAERRLQLGARAVSVFARLGVAESELNTFDDYIGAGVVLDAPFAGRAADKLGLAVASAGAGRAYRDFVERAGNGARARETIWELSYQARVNDHLTVQPDLQYVQNPAASAVPDNAWVIGVRVVARMSWAR